MTNDRYEAEMGLLTRKLRGQYRFMNMDTQRPYLLIGARTNRGNTYTLRVELNRFPQEIPQVFVTKMLYTKFGEAMTKPSAAMHTLNNDLIPEYTRICHYGTTSWKPSVSLYKIFIKARLWLEMYEQHLKTGNPIDYYLNHQD